MVILPRSTTLLLTVRHPPWNGRPVPAPTPSILIALERQRSPSPQAGLLLWCILWSSTTGGRFDRSRKIMQPSRQAEELSKSCDAIVFKQASSLWSRGKPTLSTVQILTHLLSLNQGVIV